MSSDYPGRERAKGGVIGGYKRGGADTSNRREEIDVWRLEEATWDMSLLRLCSRLKAMGGQGDRMRLSKHKQV